MVLIEVGCFTTRSISVFLVFVPIIIYGFNARTLSILHDPIEVVNLELGLLLQTPVHVVHVRLFEQQFLHALKRHVLITAKSAVRRFGSGRHRRIVGAIVLNRDDAIGHRMEVHRVEVQLLLVAQDVGAQHHGMRVRVGRRIAGGRNRIVAEHVLEAEVCVTDGGR